ARGELAKDGFGDSAGFAAGGGATRAGFTLTEHDRTFERADHVAQPDFTRLPREAVAALGPALGADDSGALQILKDLLEEPRRNVLALGDVLDLSRAPIVVKGDVE